MAIVAVAAALLVGLAAGVTAFVPDRPSISFAAETPDDVRVLATATWDRFADAFPARRECLRPVRLTAAWTHPDRAGYDPDRRLVTLRVPGTAPNLEATLAHEFGHHLEFTCTRSQRPGTEAAFGIRQSFLAAQGLPPETPWFDGATWEATPSEQFAEAVAQVVTGHPPAHQRVVLTRAALDLIRDWGRGDVMARLVVTSPGGSLLTHST
jgi:hypothetical protein